MDGTRTTTHDGAGDEQWDVDAPTAGQPQILATSVGDTCANCGTRLASDQRYCLECGERRGKPRYPLPGNATTAAARPIRSRTPRRPRLSGNGALIGGVAALLLAMAVGLQIGLSVNKAPTRGVTVQYNGSAPASSATTPSTAAATTAPSSAGTASSKSKSASKSTAPKAQTAAQKKIAKVAKSVPKTIPKSLQSSVKKVGGACSSGPGCSGGKFTGNFFGGG